MEALWDDLTEHESKVDSPGWHALVLRETEQLAREGKAKFSDWQGLPDPYPGDEAGTHRLLWVDV